MTRHVIWLSLFDYRLSREVGLFSFLEVILEQVIGGKIDEIEFIQGSGSIVLVYIFN